MASDLRLHNLSKTFTSPDGSEVHAVARVDLEIPKGELVTFLGPSGCGKTTLLRLIAGFEEPTTGDVWFGDRRVNDEPPHVRDTAMVFQSYAIFPHLDVFENVAFGLRMKRLPRAEIRQRVERVLALVGLEKLAKRTPTQLSGGQQQRVALARCIVMEPRLLLFDEPLSNLDAKLRESMRVEIRDLQRRLGITSLYVTHDQVEAMSISDRILIMNAGEVEQVGPPEEIYARPASRFVAEFIGKANFIAGVVAGDGSVRVGDATMSVRTPASARSGDAVTMVVRPEAIELSEGDGPVSGTVRRAMFLGNLAEYHVDAGELGVFTVDVANPAVAGMFDPGAQVSLRPIPEAIHVLAG